MDYGAGKALNSSAGAPFAHFSSRVWGAEDEGLPRKGVHLRLTFPGANPHPRLEPFDRLETSVNYFLGNDPAKWRTNVPVWGGVRYVDLYPGIDLEISGESGRLVQRLVARPEADLSAVRLRVEGAERVELLSSAGVEGLRLTTAVGEFTLPLLQVVAADGAPLALAPARRAVAGSEVTAPFSLSPPLSLSASPQDNPNDLLYATFLGGINDDVGSGIAVDSSGAAYVTGKTYSSDFPTTPGAYDRSFNGGDRDAFVAKLAVGGGPAPDNDDFDNASLFPEPPPNGLANQILDPDVNDATVAPDDPDMGCGAGVNSHTVWYKLIPSYYGRVRITTYSTLDPAGNSDYDTVVAVFIGQRGALQLVACNDDAPGHKPLSDLTFDAKAGETYYIEVAAYDNTPGGTLSLFVNYEVRRGVLGSGLASQHCDPSQSPSSA